MLLPLASKLLWLAKSSELELPSCGHSVQAGYCFVLEMDVQVLGLGNGDGNGDLIGIKSRSVEQNQQLRGWLGIQMQGD